MLMLDYRLKTINFTFKMINYSLVMMVLMVENCGTPITTRSAFINSTSTFSSLGLENSSFGSQVVVLVAV